VGDSIGSQKSKGKLVISDNSSVVPSKVFFVICSEINLKAIIRMTFSCYIACSQANTDILERFITVQRGIKVPFTVPLLENTMVIVNF